MAAQIPVGPPRCPSSCSTTRSLRTASISSTGTSIVRSSRGGSDVSISATGRSPPRKRPISSSGRCVADSPMRCGSTAVMAASRSSDSARCAPRLVGASAWISSMITVSQARSVSRAADPSIRYSDSGVVIRMSAGSRSIWRRSRAGVSPVRTAMRGARNGWPSASAARAIPASGARRLRSMS